MFRYEYPTIHSICPDGGLCPASFTCCKQHSSSFVEDNLEDYRSDISSNEQRSYDDPNDDPSPSGSYDDPTDDGNPSYGCCSFRDASCCENGGCCPGKFMCKNNKCKTSKRRRDGSEIEEWRDRFYPAGNKKRGTKEEIAEEMSMFKKLEQLVLKSVVGDVDSVETTKTLDIEVEPYPSHSLQTKHIPLNVHQEKIQREKAFAHKSVDKKEEEKKINLI